MNKTNWYILDAIFLAFICGGIALLSIYYSSSTECRKRFFTASDIDSRALDSFVCVCSGSICDEPKALGNLAQGATIVVYQSTRAEDRLKQKIIEFQTGGNDWGDKKTSSLSIAVDNSIKYQKIFGFGGAFTDAAGINIKSLSETTQQTLLEAYFGDKGLNYTIGRVPIASCDFSARVYSYLDTEGDFDLKTFALAPEDFNYKIPYILKAWKLSKGRIKLFASPWSAPAWMKTNNKMKNGGTIKGELNGKYYQTYAQYFVRFFQEYFKQGILFWGLTIQNEPSMGLNPLMRYQSMNFTYTAERSFIKNVLKPALTQSDPSADLKIMALDDNREYVLQWAKEMYINADKEESAAIDGLAIHWYKQGYFDDVAKAHEIQPDKFILSTEACSGFLPDQHFPLLGDWQRGEDYGHDILNGLKNWVIGWTDWNLVLDQKGGPNWVMNSVDAAIIVNKDADEFYKQPMYYFLGHFSKFIPRDSVRISSETTEFNLAGNLGDQTSVEHVAFSTPNSDTVLVVMNTDKKNSFRLSIQDVNFEGKFGQIVLPPNSIITAIWKQ